MTNQQEQQDDIVVATTNIISKQDRAAGWLVLLTVPLAWGTYTPAVKYLSDVLEPSVPGFCFSAAYYTVAAVTLGTLAVFTHNNNNNNDDDVSPVTEEEEENVPTWSWWPNAIELGTYLFLANGLQIWGLQSGVPSDRAGFLIQLTTVIVPLLQAALGPTWPTRRVLSACVLGFAGLVVMGLDNGNNIHDNLENVISQGDALILSAAVLYSLHVVRLSTVATKMMAPLSLAAGKAITEAILSLGLLFFLANIGTNNNNVVAVTTTTTTTTTSLSQVLDTFLQDSGRQIVSFWHGISSNLGVGDASLSSNMMMMDSSWWIAVGASVLWTGWITCAYTIYAQSFGQQRVSATEANLIYTAQPLFTAIFSFLFLGETLNAAGWAGAALIGSAVYLVAAAPPPTDDTTMNTENNDTRNVFTEKQGTTTNNNDPKEQDLEKIINVVSSDGTSKQMDME